MRSKFGSHAFFLDLRVKEYVCHQEPWHDLAGFNQFYGGSTLATSGVLMNMLNVPYVNFDNPWWDSSFREELTYANQLYYVIGDMNVSVTSTLMGVFFNQKLFTDYYGDHTVLYDLVHSGKWTMDVFEEYLEGTWTDVDGDAKNEEDDIHGYVLLESDIGPWLPGFNIRFCTKDDTGTPQLSFYNEKSVTAYEWLFNLFRKNPNVYFAPKTVNYIDLFKEDKAIFSTLKFSDSASSLRDMENPYGVLPMPKYDEAQEQYHNASWGESNLVGVVQNTQNKEAVGAALELLNYYSYLSVTPAYFEEALKTKYFQDADSAKMFDIIRNGVIMDFGQIYSLAIGGGVYDFDKTYDCLCRNQIRDNNENITSTYKANEQLYKECLSQILAQYVELGG